MLSYHKDRYEKIELSHYEIQMINTILRDATSKGKWFTKKNLEDLEGIFRDAINKFCVIEKSQAGQTAEI